MSWLQTYWLETFFGLIICVMGAGYKKTASLLKNERNENAAIKGGVVALLRDRIIQAHIYFVHEKGYCPIYVLDNLEEMYSEYKNLGGNGMVDRQADGRHKRS